jgi:hypothetical protein
MKRITLNLQIGEIRVWNFSARGVASSIKAARIVSPVLVVVLPIKLTMTSRLTNGLPRQFCVI